MRNEKNKFRGEYLTDTPRSSGIYAWYYSPSFYDYKSNSEVYSKIAKHAEVDYDLSINLRYGLKATSKGKTNIKIGNNGETIEKVLQKNTEAAAPLLESLIEADNFLNFTRPLYIGIAKNLYRRVYEQHYKKITDYWDSRSAVSIFLKNNPNSTVQNVIDNTLEQHSFAIEARVRCVPPKDLVVVIHQMPNLSNFDIGLDEEFELNDSKQRRSLEKVLHLLSDPICGRK